MKKFILLFALICAGACYMEVQAQTDTLEITDSTIYEVIKNDGSSYVGYILKRDAREVLIRTMEGIDLFVPTHEIAEIKKVAGVSPTGVYTPEDAFGTRYFITTNALPLRKSETYAAIQWWGPEIHYGLTDKLGIGVLTSWIGIPIVANIKYTVAINDGMNLAVGALAGTLSWIKPDGFAAMPFVSFTSGNRVSNFSVTTGGVWGTLDGVPSEFQPLASVAAMTKISKKMTFVFDSFIILPRGDSGLGTSGILTPGLRFQTSRTKAFQFGFTALFSDGDVAPFPLPMATWFYKF